MMTAMILVVEDEALLARNVRTFLERKGHNVELAATLAAGKLIYSQTQPDIILVDHNLPDGLGLDLIRHVRQHDRWTKLVMMTAFGGVDVAVSAMKSGADDYLTKPVPLDEIAIVVDRLVKQARVESSLQFRHDHDQSGLGRILGQSEAMISVKRRIRFLTAAEHQSDATGERPGPPVLILGETGTGKELVARALHFEGPRMAKPFIAVNCATLPEQLVESELFGHEKGAFTGAVDKKIGLFQAADGGTLFLDEIGELPLLQQAKLLKAIEEKAIRPVGAVREKPVNIRLIAATNASLPDRAARGEFRKDLLYRLNTITIDTPPLRDRGDDIAQLANAFLLEFRAIYARPKLSLSEGARKSLMRHTWPGNIRELRNVLEHACLLSAGFEIQSSDLNISQAVPLQPNNSKADNSNLIDVERRMIVEALRHATGNITSTARALGISRDTLRYRMEKFGMKRDDYI